MKNAARELNGRFSLKVRYAQQRKEAREQRRAFAISWQQFERLMRAPCAYCGLPSHCLDQVNPERGYVLANCVACCEQCAGAKRNHTLAEFKAWLKRVFYRCYGLCSYSNNVEIHQHD